MAQQINLVLSGGGARGIAHIGIIEILEQQGYEIIAISGTSMGGLVGGLYAAQALEAYKNWLIHADLKEAVRMLDFSLKLPGLIKGDKIMRKINQMLQIKKIEDLDIPYTAVATDLAHYEEVNFSQGKLIEAMRATISIPTVFTPVYKGDKMLVDGGLLNNIPINHLPDNGLPIIAVCANANTPMTPQLIKIMKGDQKKESEYLKKLKGIQQHIERFMKVKQPKKNNNKPGYTEILDEALHLMIAQRSNQIIAQNPPDLLINIPRKLAGTLDFLKADKIYQAGLYLGKKALKNNIKNEFGIK